MVNKFVTYNFIILCISDFLDLSNNLTFSNTDKTIFEMYKNYWKKLAVKHKLLKEDTKQNGYIECLMLVKRWNDDALYKTDAITKFLLTKTDIEGKLKRVKNPYKYSNNACHVIEVEDCIKITCMKYDGYKNYLAIKQKKEEQSIQRKKKKEAKLKKEKEDREKLQKILLSELETIKKDIAKKYIFLPDFKVESSKCEWFINYKYIYDSNLKDVPEIVIVMKKMTERENELKSELLKIKVGFRTDSTLCSRYITAGVVIEDGITYDLKFVVNRMAQMKYLYEYLHLQRYFGQAKEILREERYGDYDYDYDNYSFESYSESEDDDEEENYSKRLLALVEQLALAGGKTYPTVWPWLKEK